MRTGGKLTLKELTQLHAIPIDDPDWTIAMHTKHNYFYIGLTLVCKQ